MHKKQVYLYIIARLSNSKDLVFTTVMFADVSARKQYKVITSYVDLYYKVTQILDEREIRWKSLV